MSQKRRRHFSAEQKAQVVRRHLAGKEPVSKLVVHVRLGYIPSRLSSTVWIGSPPASEKFFESLAPVSVRQLVCSRGVAWMSAAMIAAGFPQIFGRRIDEDTIRMYIILCNASSGLNHADSHSKLRHGK